MFEFYRVYKGEFNYDNDAALTQENIEKLHGLMGRTSKVAIWMM